MTSWIAEQEFEVGDIVTFTQDHNQGPLFRLITQVRASRRQVVSDGPEENLRTYTWEYLDRGISHGRQTRDDEDYDSESSSDPQLTYWRRVLCGARRP